MDAFGRGEECWTIDYQVIHGDPRERGAGSVWEALIALREKSYPHAGGQSLRITAMGVDSGYLTQDVYDFCRKWSHKHVFATKGDGKSGKPVLSRPGMLDINHQGKKIKRGVQLWHIGTDTAKERFYGRLDLGIDKASGKLVEREGPGFQHFPRGLPDEYFDGIVSEKLLRRMVRGVEKHEWVKTRERNEPLDLKIGCYAAAVYAGLQRVNWDELERVINPAQRDIFAEAALASPAPAGPGKTEEAADGNQPPSAAETVPAEDAGRTEINETLLRPKPPRRNWATSFR